MRLGHQLVAGTTRETRPQAQRLGGVDRASPVKLSSAALRHAHHARQQPGAAVARDQPTRTKLSAKLALSDAMRMSHMQVRSQPAPMAAPLTAAMVGTSRL
jgi:hypothetical protein